MIHKGRYHSKHGKGLKRLNPKHILEKLLIALAQGQAGKASENLLNEIRQNTCSLCIKQKKLLKRYITI